MTSTPSNLYSETTTTGSVTSYRRAFYIRVSNPVSGMPNVSFAEETATLLPNGTVVTTPYTAIEPSVDVTDMTASFPTLDPTTGAPTGGNTTYAEVYSMLYSCYLAAATARDAAAAQAS